MKRLIYLISVYLTFSFHQVLSQDLNHWESIIQEGDSWKYLIPSNEPDPTWNKLDFNDESWSMGESGFGYGDGDDNTVLPVTISLYIRKKFNVVDLEAIDEMVLHMDYDDAFVAYLNGQEIARSTISGDPPRFDQPSDGLHEALMYHGLNPESFMINEEQVQDLLNQDENILAVQIHNQSLSSSDLSAIPILSVRINDNSNNYNPVPSWFSPPLKFTDSNLPVIVIDTYGEAIVDEPKIAASIGIIFNGTEVRNSVADAFNEYEGICGIEFRGESSLGFPKKSYGIEMWDSNGNDIDTSFLNFPSEEDFVLHGPYSDKSLLNNVLAMKLANDLGHYSSRTRFVELVINGDYKGVYVIMERIKRDGERVDIATLQPEDIDGDQLTGGYILRIDKGENVGNAGWESKYSAYNSNYRIFFQYFYPDKSTIQPAQKEYIKNYMDDFEEAMATQDLRNSKGRTYLDYIDLRSFVDNFLLNELSKNVDAYRLSTYFYKDRSSKGGKIHAGPLWDFNLAFGNGDYCGGDDIMGWEYYQCQGGSPFWWNMMIQNENFQNALRCRWEQLRQTTLHSDSINTYLDSMRDYLSEAQERNFQRWPTMGSYVWPNSWFYAGSKSHEELTGYMKDWIEDRSVWMDNNLPGTASSCELFDPPYDGLITSIDNKEIPSYFRLYPNPVKNNLQITSNQVIREVSVLSLTGQKMFYEYPNSNSLVIHLRENLRKGIYIVSIKTDLNIETRKILVE